ncbi:hypothetical protein HDU97_007445 [Phlyctochytrium planicorne]|nr:hypothetical protein HDU97_007445 [Phlyctochytrium planicorne]
MQIRTILLALAAVAAGVEANERPQYHDQVIVQGYATTYGDCDSLRIKGLTQCAVTFPHYSEDKDDLLVSGKCIDDNTRYADACVRSMDKRVPFDYNFIYPYRRQEKPSTSSKVAEETEERIAEPEERKAEEKKEDKKDAKKEEPKKDDKKKEEAKKDDKKDGKKEETKKETKKDDKSVVVKDTAKTYADCTRLQAEGNKKCAVYPEYSPDPKAFVRYMCINANVAVGNQCYAKVKPDGSAPYSWYFAYPAKPAETKKPEANGANGTKTRPEYDDSSLDREHQELEGEREHEHEHEGEHDHEGEGEHHLDGEEGEWGLDERHKWHKPHHKPHHGMHHRWAYGGDEEDEELDLEEEDEEEFGLDERYKHQKKPKGWKSRWSEEGEGDEEEWGLDYKWKKGLKSKPKKGMKNRWIDDLPELDSLEPVFLGYGDDEELGLDERHHVSHHHEEHHDDGHRWHHRRWLNDDNEEKKDNVSVEADEIYLDERHHVPHHEEHHDNHYGWKHRWAGDDEEEGDEEEWGLDYKWMKPKGQKSSKKGMKHRWEEEGDEEAEGDEEEWGLDYKWMKPKGHKSSKKGMKHRWEEEGDEEAEGDEEEWGLDYKWKKPKGHKSSKKGTKNRWADDDEEDVEGDEQEEWGLDERHHAHHHKHDDHHDWHHRAEVGAQERAVPLRPLPRPTAHPIHIFHPMHTPTRPCKSWETPSSFCYKPLTLSRSAERGDRGYDNVRDRDDHRVPYGVPPQLHH